MLKLHLGCGSNVRAGWVNLDLEPVPGAIACDLSKGIPYATGSVKYINSEHMIEHLTRDQGLAHLRECYRVLEPGGVIRISTPDLGTLIENYVFKRRDAYAAVGFIPDSLGAMVNEGMRSWGHQYLYDNADMMTSLTRAGFSPARVMFVVHGKSFFTEDLNKLETRPDLGDLFVEAMK